MSPSLECENIVKKFGRLTAVDNVTFNIEEGELVALIGPNGAGKSTLFSLLTGDLSLDSGRIRFKGEDITGLSPDETFQKGVGFSFQIVNLFSGLSPFDNVKISVISNCGKTYDLFHLSERSEELNSDVESVLNSLKISNYDTKLEKLPHGEKRKTDLAIPLAGDVDLLILDEPTAGIGSEDVKMIKDLIRELNEQNKTIIFSEHDLEMVYDIAPRVMVLAEGELIADGNPSKVRENKKVIDIYG